MIRPATRPDLSSMAQIEAQAMQGGWTRAQLAAELDNPRATVLVAETQNRVLGHGIAWLVADEVHILDVCVSPRARRQGIGSRLVTGLLEIGSGPGLLEVRAGNTGAIALYTSLGFAPVGTRPRYYRDGEDAVLMTLERP
jgi:ribosomal-protein-alanine acetyltransferase